MADKPEDLNEVARNWLQNNTRLVPFGKVGEQVYAISAMAVWEWLEKPDGTFRCWWDRTKKRRKIKEGKDFQIDRSKNATIKTGRGGDRKTKDYLLTTQAAKEIVASDNSPRGRAILRAMIDIIDRIEAGDEQLAQHIVGRMKDPEAAGRVASKAMEKAVESWRRQGKPEEWIKMWVQKRMDAIDNRVGFTGVLKEHGVQGAGYGIITDRMYQELFKKNTRELREELGAKKKETPRNHMGLVQLAATSLAEAKSIEALEGSSVYGNDGCNEVCAEQARQVRRALV